MSNWKDIPSGGKIEHGDCILVRKRGGPGGRWSVEIAYKAMNGTWRGGNGAYSITDERYEQWCPIPD